MRLDHSKRREALQRLGIVVLLMALLVSGDVRLPAQEDPATGMLEELHLMVGRSLVINTPTRLKRVSVADPDIADALIVNPNQILINGKSPGAVSLVLWDELDQTESFDLFVELDVLGLAERVRELFPDEPVRVQPAKDTVILSGSVSSAAVADKVVELASVVTTKVISMLEVPTAPTKGEILLEVKFAEVNRSALSQLGVNFFRLADTVGAVSTQQFGALQLQNQLGDLEFRLSDLLNIFVLNSDINLGATIRALQQKNLLQILAEPNLLTQTGKEASFLAGGEFPFPVVQGGAAGTAASVTIQFKEFGVRLTFTPTLTVDGKIHLKVRPEVSALDFTNAVTISGFFVPALSTRRIETEMELADGQSFGIAGLVDSRLTESISKIPLLGDIPLLGALFRSRTLNKSKTELMVLVTPRIVKPLPARPRPPEPKFPKPFLPPAAPKGGR